MHGAYLGWKVATQLIREAQRGKGDLVVLWLYLIRAYRLISHKLVHKDLKQYYDPGRIRGLITDHYNCFLL